MTHMSCNHPKESGRPRLRNRVRQFFRVASVAPFLLTPHSSLPFHQSNPCCGEYAEHSSSHLFFSSSSPQNIHPTKTRVGAAPAAAAADDNLKIKYRVKIKKLQQSENPRRLRVPIKLNVKALDEDGQKQEFAVERAVSIDASDILPVDYKQPNVNHQPSTLRQPSTRHQQPSIHHRPCTHNQPCPHRQTCPHHRHLPHIHHQHRPHVHRPQTIFPQNQNEQLPENHLRQHPCQICNRQRPCPHHQHQWEEPKVNPDEPKPNEKQQPPAQSVVSDDISSLGKGDDSEDETPELKSEEPVICPPKPLTPPVEPELPPTSEEKFPPTYPVYPPPQPPVHPPQILPIVVPVATTIPIGPPPTPPSEPIPPTTPKPKKPYPSVMKPIVIEAIPTYDDYSNHEIISNRTVLLIAMGGLTATGLALGGGCFYVYRRNQRAPRPLKMQTVYPIIFNSNGWTLCEHNVHICDCRICSHCAYGDPCSCCCHPPPETIMRELKFEIVDDSNL